MSRVMCGVGSRMIWVEWIDRIGGEWRDATGCRMFLVVLVVGLKCSE